MVMLLVLAAIARRPRAARAGTRRLRNGARRARPRKTQPLSLFDLLQTLGVEPRVVPEWQPLPEVVPQPERRGAATPYQSLSSACAHAPSLQEMHAPRPRSVVEMLLFRALETETCSLMLSLPRTTTAGGRVSQALA